MNQENIILAGNYNDHIKTLQRIWDVTTVRYKHQPCNYVPQIFP